MAYGFAGAFSPFIELWRVYACKAARGGGDMIGEESLLRTVPLPAMVPLDIKVYRLDFELKAPIQAADWDVLTPSERLKADKYFKHEDKVRNVVTRATLRRLLGARLNMAPESVPFSLGSYGKPELTSHKLWFNISHSGGFALLAVSSLGPVGVDIERLDPNLNIESTSSQVLAPTEIVKDVDDFFEIWVLKEAVLKCVGVGILTSLRDIMIVRNGEQVIAYRGGRVDKDIKISLIHAPKGYNAAIAWTDVT